MEKEFKQATSQWTSITEEITDEEDTFQIFLFIWIIPKWVRTYEVITSSQGIPRTRRI